MGRGHNVARLDTCALGSLRHVARPETSSPGQWLCYLAAVVSICEYTVYNTAGAVSSLVPRPSPAPAFDRLQYAPAPAFDRLQYAPAPAFDRLQHTASDQKLEPGKAGKGLGTRLRRVTVMTVGDRGGYAPIPYILWGQLPPLPPPRFRRVCNVEHLRHGQVMHC